MVAWHSCICLVKPSVNLQPTQLVTASKNCCLKCLAPDAGSLLSACLRCRRWSRWVQMGTGECGCVCFHGCTAWWLRVEPMGHRAWWCCGSVKIEEESWWFWCNSHSWHASGQRPWAGWFWCFFLTWHVNWSDCQIQHQVSVVVPSFWQHAVLVASALTGFSLSRSMSCPVWKDFVVL